MKPPRIQNRKTIVHRRPVPAFPCRACYAPKPYAEPIYCERCRASGAAQRHLAAPWSGPR